MNKKAAHNFLKKTLPKLELFYDYFLRYRLDKKSGLVFCVHPHETGRDSDPTYDNYKVRLPRNGPNTLPIINYINTCLDYASALYLNVKKNFRETDIMFNCMLVDNLYILGTLQKSIVYKKHAVKLEKNILRSLSEHYISVNHLFPLVLPRLSRSKLAEIIQKLEDENYYKTPFPVPSVVVNSPNFDPHYTEKERLWRGPTWINANWYLVERGLKVQVNRQDISLPLKSRMRNVIRDIEEKSKQLVKKGYFEFYDPYTGKGYRVKNFGMSTLAKVFS